MSHASTNSLPAARTRPSICEIVTRRLALRYRNSRAIDASPGSTGVELLSIGLLGAAATLGVLAYELRNTQLRRVAAARVRPAAAADLPAVEQAERGSGGRSEDEVRAQVLPQRLEVVFPDRLVHPE